MELKILNDYFKRATEILPKGAFLTTKDGDRVNTMTIGWGAFGFEWGMPVVEVMVRQSRFTKIALDKNSEFTLTFPSDDEMKSALGFCGSHSGRDIDKIKECNITLRESEKIKTPAVYCKGIVFECRVVAKCEMDDNLTADTIKDKWYKNGDFHSIYYSEIQNCYEIK